MCSGPNHIAGPFYTTLQTGQFAALPVNQLSTQSLWNICRHFKVRHLSPPSKAYKQSAHLCFRSDDKTSPISDSLSGPLNLKEGSSDNSSTDILPSNWLFLLSGNPCPFTCVNCYGC